MILLWGSDHVAGATGDPRLRELQGERRANFPREEGGLHTVRRLPRRRRAERIPPRAVIGCDDVGPKSSPGATSRLSRGW